MTIRQLIEYAVFIFCAAVGGGAGGGALLSSSGSGRADVINSRMMAIEKRQDATEATLSTMMRDLSMMRADTAEMKGMLKRFWPEARDK